MNDKYSTRIDEFFYSRTDEKRIGKKLIEKVLERGKIGSALDIGPGPGLLTEPLYNSSQKIHLVEIDDSYSETLKAKFPNAEITIGSFVDLDFSQEFDLILASQVLYYIKESEWHEIFRKLLKWTVPGGILLTVMNLDQGDWWNIVEKFKQPLGDHCKFHYQGWTKFKESLMSLGSLESVPYQYSVEYDTFEAAAQAIGHQWLEIYDRQLLEEYESKFVEFAKSQFKLTEGKVVMNIESELTILKAPN